MPRADPVSSTVAASLLPPSGFAVEGWVAARGEFAGDEWMVNKRHPQMLIAHYMISPIGISDLPSAWGIRKFDETQASTVSERLFHHRRHTEMKRLCTDDRGHNLGRIGNVPVGCLQRLLHTRNKPPVNLEGVGLPEMPDRCIHLSALSRNIAEILNATASFQRCSIQTC